MAISRKDVEHIAALARINVSEEEKAGLEKDLNNILVYVEELQKLDTENTEITVHTVDMENRLREDVVKEGFTTEEALKNAPLSFEGYLTVPAVIEVENDN